MALESIIIIRGVIRKREGDAGGPSKDISRRGHM